MKKKDVFGDVLDKAADVFDLPAEVIAGVPRVTVTGCRRIFIENHKGILEYAEDAITINGGRTVIKIKGDGLGLRSMNDSELLIIGNVYAMEFEK